MVLVEPQQPLTELQALLELQALQDGMVAPVPQQLQTAPQEEA